MKTIIYFIFTCGISTGCMFGALNAPNPYPLFAVAFGIWALFIWGCYKRAKRKAEQRNRERLFEEFMLRQMRNKQ
ncbi:MAG: hypothetical protein ACXVJN_11160 [Mucilaginibacter sp.]